MNTSRIVVVSEKDEIITHKHRDTLAEGDFYRVSALWLRNEQGEILLAQRAFNKKHHPGMWGPAVAGTVDEGESYEENIYKEAEEEIGLTEHTFIEGPYVQPVLGRKYFTQWYMCTTAWPIEKFTKQDDEVEALRFYSLEEIRGIIAKDTNYFLKGLEEWLEVFEGE